MDAVNNLFKRIIRLGFLPLLIVTLMLGSFTPVQAAAPTGGTYTCETPYLVQWGDTLYKIGLRFGVSWPMIAANNGIGYPYWVYAGQYLCISGPGYSYGYPGYSYPYYSYYGYNYYNYGVGVTITNNIVDKNVSIQTSWLPRYEVYDVLIGTCQNAGYGGTWVGKIATDGVDGVYSGKYKIPAAYHGISCLAVRLTSQVSGSTGYATFSNGTGSSVTAPLDFSVISVVRNKTVTIIINNATKGLKYKIYIGHEGTGATGGTYVATFIPDSNKPATLTYKIPEKLKGSTRLDLRIKGMSTGEDIYHTFRNSTH